MDPNPIENSGSTPVTPTPEPSPTTNNLNSAPQPEPAPASNFTTMQAVPGERRGSAARIAIIAILLVVLGGGLVIWAILGLLGKHGGANQAEIDKAFEADAVFIREDNKNGNYALFNIDTGAQITDFIFEDHSEFIDGYAVVSKDDDTYGIIKDDGKMATDFGEYDYISDYCGAFFVRNDEVSKAILGNGKQISADGDEVSSGSLFCDYEYPFFVYDNGQNSTLYNYHGNKLVTELPRIDDLEFEYLDTTDMEHNEELAIRSGDSLVVLDSKQGKLAFQATIPASYEISDYSRNEKMMVLRDDNDSYALYINDKIVDYDSDECASVGLADVAMSGKDLAFCAASVESEPDVELKENDDTPYGYFEQDDKMRIYVIKEDGSLDKEGSVDTDYYSIASGIPVFSSGTYAKKVKTGVEFYENAKLSTTLEDGDISSVSRIFGSAMDAYLVVKNDSLASVYGLNGKKMFDIDSRCSEFVYYFTKDFGICRAGLVTQLEDYAKRFFIIDKDGKVTLGGFEDVEPIDMQAAITAIVADDYVGLINNHGDILVNPNDKKYTDYESLSEVQLVSLEYTEDGKSRYDVYNAEGEKLLSVSEEIDVYDSLNPKRILETTKWPDGTTCDESHWKTACAEGAKSTFYTVTGQLIYAQK